MTDRFEKPRRGHMDDSARALIGRRATPAPGVRAQTAGDAVPRDFADEEDSQAYEDPNEQTRVRLGRVTRKVDALAGEVGQLKEQHGTILKMVQGIGEKADKLVDAMDADRKTREDRAEAARLEREAAEERKAKAEAEEAARKAAQLEADRKDRAEGRKLWANTTITIVTAILSGLAVIIAATRGGAPSATVTNTPPAVVQPAERP